MLWKNRRQSTNVEDRRGMHVSRGVVGGGIGGVVIVVIALLLGVNPGILLDQTISTSTESPEFPAPGKDRSAEDELGEFASVVLADTEDVWHKLFQAGGRNYREPSLVLFSQAAQSACGFAQSAMGPFYCPLDNKIYLDLIFFRELKTRFRAPGDFAQAYVIAHEVGHHVQTLLGITDQVNRVRNRLSQTEANLLSVRVELQADCLAGVWAYHADRMKGILEPGDIEEALGAASSIGDDLLQRQTQGTVVPDSFTHGSSQQRVRWFRRGFEMGDLNACNTFDARGL